MFDIILAVDENYGIGKNNKLCWDCKIDLKYFTKVTKGTSLIVGRKTWESMPHTKILKDRKVIVVSKTLQDSRVTLCETFEEALQYAKNERIFVIGGLQLYKEALSHKSLNKLHITYINGTYDCDTFIPEVKEKVNTLSLESKIVHSSCTICVFKQPFS